MIKGRSPFPFETIVLGISFTPGLPSLVAETKRLCDLHSAKAVFIHVGKKTGEKQRDLAGILTMFGFHDGNSKLYWEQGDIVGSILRVGKNEVADLIVLGLSQRADFQLPAGHVAKDVSIKAKCSVLLYSNRPAGSYKNIVVNASENRKTELTVSTALYFAEKENASQLHITDYESSDDEMNSLSDTDQISIPVSKKVEMKVEYFSLEKENCKTITEFAFRNGTELIITNSSDHHLLIFDRISTHDGIDTLLKDLPCNLLIVHSRSAD